MVFYSVYYTRDREDTGSGDGFGYPGVSGGLKRERDRSRREIGAEGLYIHTMIVVYVVSDVERSGEKK
jgi:hypothetical protein